MRQRRHTEKRRKLLTIIIDTCFGWSCEECPISCKKDMELFNANKVQVDYLRKRRKELAMKEYKRAYGLETLKNDILEHGI